MLLLLGACAATKRKKATRSSAQPTSYESVMIRRTACFGRCPDYSLLIRKDGLVRYTAYRFTAMTGIYEHRIPTAIVSDIFKQFKDNQADTCQNEYRVLASDLPALHITLQNRNGEKNIRNAHYGPKYLVQIAEDIDQKIKPDASWKKVGAISVD